MAIKNENAESAAAGELARALNELEQRGNELREALRLVAGEKIPDAAAANGQPDDKPDAIIRVLRLSNLPSLSAMAIWGALDTRGWLTDKDLADDKHFYKTLATMTNDGRLSKPRRGHFALGPRAGGRAE